MKERLCQYGNCQETKVWLTINRLGERNTFCSDEHALEWLKKYCKPQTKDVENSA